MALVMHQNRTSFFDLIFMYLCMIYVVFLFSDRISEAIDVSCMN